MNQIRRDLGLSLKLPFVVLCEMIASIFAIIRPKTIAQPSHVPSDYGRDALSEEWRPISFREGSVSSTVALPPIPEYTLPLWSDYEVMCRRLEVMVDSQARAMRQRLFEDWVGKRSTRTCYEDVVASYTKVGPWITTDLLLR